MSPTTQIQNLTCAGLTPATSDDLLQFELNVLVSSNELSQASGRLQKLIRGADELSPAEKADLQRASAALELANSMAELQLSRLRELLLRASVIVTDAEQTEQPKCLDVFGEEVPF